LFFVLIFLMPQLANAAGLYDDCSAEFCGDELGLVCVEVDGYKECRGGIGYITSNPEDCSPELIWQDGRCQLDIGQAQGEQLGLGESARDIRDNIRTAINIALGFLGIAGVIMLIYAGVLWMTSRGNEEQVLKAKKSILWTVAGLVIIGTSWTITSYILGLGGGGAGGGAGRGGRRGGDGGPPFPPTSFADQLEITKVNTEHKDDNPKENVYLKCAIEIDFNKYIDETLVEDAELAETLKIVDIESEIPVIRQAGWATVINTINIDIPKNPAKNTL